MSFIERNSSDVERQTQSDVKRKQDVRPPKEIGESNAPEKAPKEIGESTEQISDTKETEKNEIIKQNRENGLERQKIVYENLLKQYPESEGYQILAEQYLRDAVGNIVKDPITGEKRRIDFVVVKDGKVIDSIEVTSPSAPKEEQTSKEKRIREAGGNYIKDSDGNLCQMDSNLKTRIERVDLNEYHNR